MRMCSWAWNRSSLHARMLALPVTCHQALMVCANRSEHHAPPPPCARIKKDQYALACCQTQQQYRPAERLCEQAVRLIHSDAGTCMQLAQCAIHQAAPPPAVCPTMRRRMPPLPPPPACGSALCVPRRLLYCKWRRMAPCSAGEPPRTGHSLGRTPVRRIVCSSFSSTQRDHAQCSILQ